MSDNKKRPGNCWISKEERAKRQQPHDLKTIFGKFVGKTLKDPKRVTCDSDDVLMEMETVAKKNGLKLRVLFPGVMTDFGNDQSRANVTVEQDASGKLRVANKFNIG